MKICSKCKTEKEDSEFYNKRPECKKCLSEKSKSNYLKNKEIIIEKTKTNYENNKEKIKEYRKQYRVENKNNLSKQQKKWQLNKPLFSTYSDSLKNIENINHDKDGYLKVECNFCNKSFYPTNLMVRSRISAINNKNHGEHRFYCSKQCKDSCPVYKQKKYRKNEVKNSKRETSSEFNKIVFEERNNECEKCGSKEKLQIHHIKGYTLFPELRFDLNNVLLLCKECHKDIHKKNDCKTNQLKCNKQGE